jgi:hypothetical protein
VIYLIGSLRNPQIPLIANELRSAGHEVFADWYAAGSTADDHWRDYEKSQGYTYLEALDRPAAVNVFEFDKRYLTLANTVVLVAPAGKSGHMEFGWALGQGKRGYYLLDDPDRWDVMLQFATKGVGSVEELIKALRPLGVDNRRGAGDLAGTGTFQLRGDIFR